MTVDAWRESAEIVEPYEVYGPLDLHTKRPLTPLEAAERRTSLAHQRKVSEWERDHFGPSAPPLGCETVWGGDMGDFRVGIIMGVVGYVVPIGWTTEDDAAYNDRVRAEWAARPSYKFRGVVAASLYPK